MRCSVYLTSVFILLAGIFFVGCSDDEDKNVTGDNNVQTYVDSVWVSDATVSEGEQTVITINFSNSQQLIRVEVPLKVYGTGFYIDSVSFIGSRCPTDFLQLVTIDTADQWVRTLWNGGPNLGVGSGLWANMYITANPGSSGGSLTIDSATIGTYPSSYFLYFMKSSGGLIYPGFSGGAVTIN